MTTLWKLEKVYTRLRASEASDFFFKYISALKTYDSSQISIYTLLINHYLSVQYVHDCVRNTRDMVLFIILTRKQETWEKWYRASGESEPKFVYFCVGKMFYIPTRNSRKSYYKWLRAIIVCVCVWNMRFFSYGWGPGAALVCLKHAILLIRVGSRGPGGGAPGSSRYNKSLCWFI